MQKEKKQRQTLKIGEKILFITIAAFIGLAGLAYVGMEYVRLHRDKPMFRVSANYQFSEEGLRGDALFRHNGCMDCHRVLGNGTNMGPGADLDGEGSKRSLDWLYSFLRTPEETYRVGDGNHKLGGETVDHGAGKAGKYVSALPAQKLHAIATFLSELKVLDGSPMSPVPPEGKSGFIDSMVKKFAPDEWSHKYNDARHQPVADKQAEGDKP